MMTEPRIEYDARQPEYIQCSRKAKWQICDEMPVDNDTFSCTEHVSEMISDTTNIIVPCDESECCYCYDTPHDLVGAIEARLAAATPGPWRGMARNVYIDDEPIRMVVCQYWTGTIEWSDTAEKLPVKANVDLIAHAPADLRALLDEVKRLRHDDAIWEKHGLVQIVTARDELREEVKRLQLLLETEQRAKWAAQQDEQHRREEAERLRLQVAQLAEALEVAIG